MRVPAWVSAKVSAFMARGGTGRVRIDVKDGRVRSVTLEESWLPPVSDVECGRCGGPMKPTEGGYACPECGGKLTHHQAKVLA